ncbi:hypothetical protein D3C80_1999670 [compost metagenome]
MNRQQLGPRRATATVQFHSVETHGVHTKTYQASGEAGFVVQDERLAPRLGLTLSRRVADIVAIDIVITQV